MDTPESIAFENYKKSLPGTGFKNKEEESKYSDLLNAKYIAEARLTCPEGIICGVCGEENDNADDVGWWCAYYRGKYVAHCDKCAWAKGLFPHHGER